MFVRSSLFSIAPSSGKVLDLFGGNVLTRAYYRWYTSTRDKLATWHKRELKKLDRRYALREAEHQLVNAREEALRMGIDPLDPKYPDLQDFYEAPEV